MASPISVLGTVSNLNLSQNDMHLKRLYQTVNTTMSLDQSHLLCFTSLIFIIWFHTYRAPKKCIILYYHPN